MLGTAFNHAVHVTRCVVAAIGRPTIAVLGMREFRSDLTTHFDYPEIEAYDSGRELAHLVTLRRWD